MILSDFLSRQDPGDENTKEIVPISFNMTSILQDKYYNVNENEEKYMEKPDHKQKLVEYNCQRCMVQGRD